MYCTRSIRAGGGGFLSPKQAIYHKMKREGEKYRLTLKNSQAIVPGDDISRHDSFRLAPAPRLALDEERTPWSDLSAIERSPRDDATAEAKQRGEGKEGDV